MDDTLVAQVANGGSSFWPAAIGCLRNLSLKAVQYRLAPYYKDYRVNGIVDYRFVHNDKN